MTTKSAARPMGQPPKPAHQFKDVGPRGDVRPKIHLDPETLALADVYCADFRARSGATIARGELLGQMLTAGMLERMAKEGWTFDGAVLAAVERNGGMAGAARELGLPVGRVAAIVAASKGAA